MTFIILASLLGVEAAQVVGIAIPVLTVAGVALLVYCAAQYTRFAMRFWRLTWKRTREGRHLMGQSRVLAVMLWATLLLAVVPVPLWLALVVQVGLFGWLAFEATRRNHLLTVNQRDAAESARKAYSSRRSE